MATGEQKPAYEDVPAGVLCWHIHHDRLLEMSTVPLAERAQFIRYRKFDSEIPCRLRLLAAHHRQPETQVRPLRDSFPARRALPQRGARYAQEAHSPRCFGMCAGARTEPVLQLAYGSLCSNLPHD